MKQIEAISHHGWGFSKSFFDSYTSLLPFNISPNSRGYFSQEKNASFQEKKSFKIVLTHSLGLHFIKDFSSIDLLVIFGGFVHFTSSHDRHNNIILSKMLRKLQKDPTMVLNDFYTNCYYPTPSSITPSKIKNIKLLEDDLLFLKNNHLNIEKVKKSKKILIFHGTHDKIVTVEKGEELHNHFSNSSFYKIPLAGHVFNLEQILHSASIIEKFLPNNPYKHQMTQNFSSNAKTYDKTSIIQKKVSKTLIGLLTPLLPNLLDGPVLEIGAGTGSISKHLLDMCKNRKIIISDISQNMLTEAKKNLSSKTKKNTTFTVLDGEKVIEKETFSLIISSMTFQWFYEMEKSIKNLYQALKPKGIMLFSFLAEKSFMEWKNLCKKNSLSYTGNNLPHINTMRSILSDLSLQSTLFDETIIQHYPSLKDFFLTLKHTGTSTSINQKKLSPKKLKTLFLAAQDTYTKSMPITYQIGYGYIKKE